MSGLTVGGYYQVVNLLTDQQLLREYTERASEAAFTELLRRHIDFVYSAALRMLGDAHLAEDVTQGVFLALAKNALELADRPTLAGWLHRTARNLAANTVRSDTRRRAREHNAAAMNQLLSPEPEADWERIAPDLDEALTELDDADRDALLSRYFQRKSAREIAEALGITEDAAQKRLSRAIERLRALLAARGVKAGAGGLILAISSSAVQAAPLGLSAAISTALVGTTPVSLAASTTKAITMTTFQKTAIIATLVAAVGTGIYQARRASILQAEAEFQRQRQSQFAAQVAQLILAGQDAARRLDAVREENARLNRNAIELLRLRGELTQLRAASDQARDAAATTEMALKSWLARVRELKRLPERMPGKAIPELRLLTEEDWLELAKDPFGHDGDEVTLDDDATARRYLSNVRAKAKDKLMRVLSRAIEGYANAHDGQLPAESVQLKPHLMNRHFDGPARAVEISESAVDDAVLERYAVLQTGKLVDVPDDKAILAEKAPVDSEHDTRLKVGKYWMQVGGISDYSTGNDGREP